MLYLATSFWLLAAVLMAWGVHVLWCRLARPRTIDRLLLPGTVAAQLGRIVGLLITGANPPSGAGKEASGAEGMDAGPTPRMPVAGPMIVALVPLGVLATLIYVISMRLGGEVLSKIPVAPLPTEPPTSLGACWEQLRALLTLGEATLNAVREARGGGWRIVAFVYLMICMTVRMAPFPGNGRGHIGAAASFGLLALISASVFPSLPESIVNAWPLLCLTVGWLLLLLLGSLLLNGLIMSARLFLNLGPGGQNR